MTRIFEGLQHTPIKRIDRQVRDFRYDRVELDEDGKTGRLLRGDDHQEIRWEAIFVSAVGLPEMTQLMVTLDAEPPLKRQWNGIAYHRIRYDTKGLRVWYVR